MEFLWKTLWSEWFWLPDGFTWKEVEFHPNRWDIVILVSLAVFFVVLRELFETYISKPVGRYLGLKDEHIAKAPPNYILESFYLKNKNPKNKDLANLSKQVDFSQRKLERWFRLRKNQDRTKPIIKFSECCWRCLFYFIIFWYGVYILYDKTWLWNREESWEGWPNYNVPNELYWYYTIEVGFYLSLVITLFTSIKRKDFNEQIIHHICAIGLMFFSCSVKFLRLGSVVLLLHDAVDYWLEACKMTSYIAAHNKSWQRITDYLFIVFVIIWIGTRMTLFPIWILSNTLFIMKKCLGMWPLYVLLNIMMIVLQILHIFWFYYIIKIVIDTLKKGKTEKDSRSDSDEIEILCSNESDTEMENTKIPNHNKENIQKRTVNSKPK